MKTINLTLLLLLTSLCCFAQYGIKGRVINQSDTRPVANASVFISNATIGDRTANDGTFSLKGIKPGKYELVVSLVGFDKYTQVITVDNGDITLPDITISAKTIALNEVKIKATDDPRRKQNYEWFKEEFLGRTELAKECSILNPELLDLSYDAKTGVLTASSVDFLIIENKALGYRVKYLLSDFMANDDEVNKKFMYAGSVFFERLKGTPDEEEQWKARRQQVYEGSQIHFLRSVLNNRIEQEGFRVLRYAITLNLQRPADSVIKQKIALFTSLKADKSKSYYKDSLNYWVKKQKLPVVIRQELLSQPLTIADIVNQSGQRGLFGFFPGGIDALFISYSKYHQFRGASFSQLSGRDGASATLLGFNEPALVDGNGSVTNPLSLSYDGAWSRNRLANLLPVDYEPTGNSETEADSALIKNISARVNSFAAAHLTEKAYLHFDKPYYATGDTIYFSAYVTEGAAHVPYGQSTILHADLIGPDNKICKSEQLLIKDGTARGDFALADTLKAGDYRVRAYTKLMQNADEPQYFERSIPIGTLAVRQVPEAAVPVNQPKDASPVTRFLPEGGSFITGVKSKIAFKGLAANGLGADVKGVILDNDNKEIASFTSSHLGMGYLYLIPAEGKTYRANITYADGRQDIVTLPQSSANGISMEVTPLNLAYTVKIGCGKPYYQNNKNKLFTLMTYSGGAPLAITFKLNKQETILTLPKKDLRTGIAKATLFSAVGEPLCERLLFVQNDDLLKMGLSNEKPSTGNRQKVTMQLKVDNGGEPLAGHYSVSVMDEGKVAADELSEPTIINNLLLTSELKGYVEQPNYYFAHVSERTAADLDLVMLTHGYRSFEWKKILDSDNKTTTNKPEKGLAISGSIKKAGKPVPNAKVKLFTKTGGTMMLDTTTDVNGRFVFDNLTFSDSTKFVLQARTVKGDREVDVEPDKPVAPQVAKAFLPLGPSSNGALTFYVQSKKQFSDEQKKYGINEHAQMLKEVFIKDKKISPFEHSANLNGKGNADQVITADWLATAGYSNLYDAVRAKAINIQFTQDHKLHSMRSIFPDEFMLVIVDGTPMLVGQMPPGIYRGPLDDIDASEVESVEIQLGAHGGAMYGSQAANGVIIVTTKWAKPKNNYYREAPGVIVYKAGGFYKAREFYSPQYDNPHTNQKMADLRSTIYWNPDIITDKDGKASFSYFNADGKGTYRLVIEGIDAGGNLGRRVLRYKVE